MNITLYSTGCPKCNVLVRKLTAKHIEYDVVDDVDTMLAMGLQSVPWLKVGDKMLDFKQANDWLNEQ